MLQMSLLLKLALVALLLPPFLVDPCRGDTSPFSSYYNGAYPGANHGQWSDWPAQYDAPYGNKWPFVDYHPGFYEYRNQLKQVSLLKQQLSQLQEQLDRMEVLRERLDSLETMLGLNTSNSTSNETGEPNFFEKVESNILKIENLTSKQVAITDDIRTLRDETIKKLEDDQGGLQRQVTGISNDLRTQNSDLTSLENRVINLEEKKQDAFTARLTDGASITLDTNDKLIFPDVIYDVNNAYGATNGCFRSKYTGTYAFFTTVRPANSSQALLLAFYKNNNRLLDVTHPSAISEGTGLVTTHMNENDEVCVQHGGSSSTEFTASSSDTLSGWLVSLG